MNHKVGSYAGQKVKGDLFPRRKGNWGRLQRRVYLLLDEGHQVGSEGGPIPLHWFQTQLILIWSQGRRGTHLSL